VLTPALLGKGSHSAIVTVRVCSYVITVLLRIYRMVYAQLSCRPLDVSTLTFLTLLFTLTFLTVGAMFYLSPTLTALMLAVVPPVSLGAVRRC
jgi:hypothetical protein